MGSPIEARRIVKDLLNANVLDPYPTDLTRPGSHFYDEADGINLTRANTFPKGYITSDTTENSITDIGYTGHIERSINLNVWYFVKDKISYNDGTYTYKEEDYVQYMSDLIFKTLIANKKLGNGYHIKQFNTSEGPQKSVEGTFSVYYDVVSFVVYWDEQY